MFIAHAVSENLGNTLEIHILFCYNPSSRTAVLVRKRIAEVQGKSDSVKMTFDEEVINDDDEAIV